MAYDDLFEDDFEFIDGDSDVESELDDDVEAQETDNKGKKDKVDDEPPSKGKKKRPAAKKSSSKSATEKAKKDKPDPTADSQGDKRDREAASAEDSTDEAPKPEEPAGPPADHVVHIYEFGTLKRTIPRAFVDADAVAFAEEYSRTGKAYGRLAVPAHKDDVPAESFADAAKQ